MTMLVSGAARGDQSRLSFLDAHQYFIFNTPQLKIVRICLSHHNLYSAGSREFFFYVQCHFITYKEEVVVVFSWRLDDQTAADGQVTTQNSSLKTSDSVIITRHATQTEPNNMGVSVFAKMSVFLPLSKNHCNFNTLSYMVYSTALLCAVFFAEKTHFGSLGSEKAA